ncbi:uracil-DNA glycosylase family protein [Novosphingobium sp. CF614]|uniref:uracil-DNA glycosylase family protein n=1 Tax=Novosphingobium sp. CF614 TaxID=1884364 RepID=UPI0015A676D7|nr:uracil-DNA glycosylase family protein [Novosphingobium sp. CF614]
MDHRPNPEFLDDIAGALDWWRDAGVDCDFLDQPREWLTSPELARDPRQGPRGAAERPAARAAQTAPESIFASGLDPGSFPADLAAFAPWWLSEPMLDDGATGGRIAPCGPAGAKLMILVEEPEAADRDALLTGPQGRLLDAMLAAFGTGRDAVYLASALPRHTPAADWSALEQRGIGRVLAHHVALAAPERLLVLGGNILPLLGHESPQRPAVLRQFNQEGRTIPMLASWGLPALLAQPRAKPVLWKAWLEWTAA